MTRMTLRYDNQTHRITQTYWGGDNPDWADKQRAGTTVTTTQTTQQTRADALKSAHNSLEAGADYDPETQTPVGKLCYDPNADELYGEVEIRPVQE